MPYPREEKLISSCLLRVTADLARINLLLENLLTTGAEQRDFYQAQSENIKIWTKRFLNLAKNHNAEELDEQSLMNLASVEPPCVFVSQAAALIELKIGIEVASNGLLLIDALIRGQIPQQEIDIITSLAVEYAEILRHSKLH
jgi:hypothetical protein